MMWTSVRAPTTRGSSTMCHISICPGLSTLKKAPAPMEFRPSLAWPPIHWESKFDCDRKPVNDVPIEIPKSMMPLIHVRARLPRQAAIQNLPQRWTTMNPKHISTLHRCTGLKKRPSEETCHQAEPPIARKHPEATTTTRDARVSTPKT